MRVRLTRVRAAAALGVSGLVIMTAFVGFVAVSLLRVPVDDGVALPDRRAFEIYDRTGTRVAVRGVARSSPDALATVPDVLADAVVAIEDRRFYDHWGLDLYGVARAAAVNLLAMDVRQGGSTITQQLAKMAYLSSERTLTRKTQEAALAVWLDARLSKQEVLRRYLQHAYFGNGVYGASAAARRYFDKHPADLTVGEAALLAGLIRAPSRLNPAADRDAAQARADLVLDAMEETGRIDPAEADRARANPADLAAPLAEGEVGSYFASWAEQRAHTRLGDVYGDFALRTTLEPAVQRVLEQTVSRVFEERENGENLQVALVALRPDGAVAGMVGGRRYQESQFNRATQARRQPGSLFKAFVYLAALERGIRPESRVVDEPVTVDGWRPRNYRDGHRGPVSVETAFADSINTVAVKLAERVGRERVIETARRLGLGPDLPDVPSLALGAAETSLLEITGAYAAIAADDASLRPYGLRALESGALRLYDRPSDTSHQPVARTLQARSDLLRLLRASVQNGTGQAAGVDDLAVRGKTGTSQDQRDAWFVGFVDGLTLGVWVGRDDAGRTEIVGGGLPARIFQSAVSAARDQGLIAPGPETAAIASNERERDTPAQSNDISGLVEVLPGKKPAPSDIAPEAPAAERPSAERDRSAPRASRRQAPDAGSPSVQEPRDSQHRDASEDTRAPERASPPAVFQGRPKVLDTATLSIDGHIVKLHGVGRGTQRFTDEMRAYIGSRSVVCRHLRAREYRCEVEGYDLAEVVVHNGGARAGPQAPPAVVRAETQARRAGRGLWGR